MGEEEISTAISNGTSIVKMLLEPRQIKKVSNAIGNSYSDAKRLVDSNNNPAFIQTDNFFVCNVQYSQLLKMYGCPESPLGARQLDNITRIITNEKIDVTLINEEEIDFELLSNILDKIRFVSDETLSKAWSKLLKNEIENKHKYSMRTIDLLSHLSSEEANLFYNMCGSIFYQTEDKYYFFSDSKTSGKELLDRSLLMEVGFIGSEELNISDSNFFWNGYYITTKGSISFFKLSRFGIDIYQLIEKEISAEDCKKELDLQKQLTSWSIHKMIDENRYDTKPILSKDQF